MPRKAKASPAQPVLAHQAAAREECRARLGLWFRQQGRDLPWRRTHDPYAILVSELMLQQTQVATVLPYFARWMERFPTVAALASAAEQEVLSAWQGLGYYARARNLHRAARYVVEELGGAMPRELAGLLRLPGAGRYTAGAIASFAYDLPAPAVDANIARVLARLFCVREPIDATAGRDAVWAAAELLLPASGGRLHTSALMELGALVCLPRRPRCEVCPVSELCAGREIAAELPAKKARRATVALEENCAWVQRPGAILLEQQQGNRWRGLWKLPALVGQVPPREPLWRATYPFTHHRVELRVFSALPPVLVPEQQAWFALEDLPEAPLTAPHRRAVEGLLKYEAALAPATE